MKWYNKIAHMSKRNTAKKRRRLAIIYRKEVMCMPITITIHVFGFTITIRVKSNNRHSGQ